MVQKLKDFILFVCLNVTYLKKNVISQSVQIKKTISACQQ
jgi:hypothetical protein